MTLSIPLFGGQQKPLRAFEEARRGSQCWPHELSALVPVADYISCLQAGTSFIGRAGGLWNQSQEEGQGGLSLNHDLFPCFPDYSLKDVRSCAMNGFKIGAAIKAVYVSLGVSVGSCQGILKEIKGEGQGHCNTYYYKNYKRYLYAYLPSFSSTTKPSLSLS